MPNFQSPISSFVTMLSKLIGSLGAAAVRLEEQSTALKRAKGTVNCLDANPHIADEVLSCVPLSTVPLSGHVIALVSNAHGTSAAGNSWLAGSN